MDVMDLRRHISPQPAADAHVDRDEPMPYRPQTESLSILWPYDTISPPREWLEQYEDTSTLQDEDTPSNLHDLVIVSPPEAWSEESESTSNSQNPHISNEGNDISPTRGHNIQSHRDGSVSPSHVQDEIRAPSRGGSVSSDQVVSRLFRLNWNYTFGQAASGSPTDTGSISPHTRVPLPIEPEIRVIVLCLTGSTKAMEFLSCDSSRFDPRQFSFNFVHSLESAEHLLSLDSDRACDVVIIAHGSGLLKYDGFMVYLLKDFLRKGGKIILGFDFLGLNAQAMNLFFEDFDLSWRAEVGDSVYNQHVEWLQRVPLTEADIPDPTHVYTLRHNLDCLWFPANDTRYQTPEILYDKSVVLYNVGHPDNLYIAKAADSEEPCSGVAIRQYGNGFIGYFGDLEVKLETIDLMVIFCRGRTLCSRLRFDDAYEQFQEFEE